MFAPARLRLISALLLLGLSCSSIYATSGSAEGPRVYFVVGCSGSVFQPETIALTCADGKVRFEATEGWEEWTSTGASTHGTLTFPDCPSDVPLYACRDYAEHESLIHLWRPVYCPTIRHWQFTRLRVVDLEGDGPVGFDRASRYTCQSFRHEPIHLLGRAAAKASMRKVLSRPRLSYDDRAGGRLHCGRRLSKTRIGCEMSWVIGDAGYVRPRPDLADLPAARKACAFAYLVGESAGKDLDEARRLGVVSGLAHGKSIGTRRGSRVGRRAGLARGFQATYPDAYRKAYRQAFDAAGLEEPARREIRLVAP